MTRPSGYTGPTSGGFTIGPEGVTNRKRFYDEPLSRDERDAVAWFTELSPHEQLREVRRLKWNADERATVIEENHKIIVRQNAEIVSLGRKLSDRRPDRFEVPRAAGDLLTLATLYGWRTAKAWIPVDFTDAEGERIQDPDWFRFEIVLGLDGIQFQLSWAVPADGRGRGSMVRRGLARYPRRDWHDAPSLIKIKKIIRDGLPD